MGEFYVSQFAMKLAAFLSASLCPAAAWRCYQLAHHVTSIRGSIHLTTEGLSTYHGIAQHRWLQASLACVTSKTSIALSPTATSNIERCICED